jgi:hypothetical protein
MGRWKYGLAVMTAVIAVSGTQEAFAARRATRTEAARMINAVRGELRIGRCRVTGERISSQDELYGAVYGTCRGGHGSYHTDWLLERDPWHVVTICLSKAIYHAIRDLHSTDVRNNEIACKEYEKRHQAEGAEEPLWQEEREEEEATLKCQAEHTEFVSVGSAEFKCP